MFLDKLVNVEKRYLELENNLSSSEIIADRNKFTKLSKELSEVKIKMNSLWQRDYQVG